MLAKKLVNKNKNLGVFVSVIILGVMMMGSFVSFVGAFGVASHNSFEISPGQTKEALFIIQNVIGGDDIVVDVIFLEGSEIATLVDSDLRYNVPAGGQVNVPVRVTISADASVGTEYRVSALFKQIQVSEEGVEGAQVIGNIEKSFPVIVIEESLLVVEPEEVEEAGGGNFWLWAIGIIILIIIIWLVLKKKKKSGDVPVIKGESR